MSGRHSAYLGLGGNLGNPLTAMAAALQALDQHPEIEVTAVSPVYSTPPWGKVDQPDFLNAVVGLDTALKPRQLLDSCLDAEHRLKRVRSERWGPRVIDIDLLWYEGEVVDEPGLQVPHPRMLSRAFVMVPLAYVAPSLDLEGVTAAQIAARLDQAGIERVTTDENWWRA